MMIRALLPLLLISFTAQAKVFKNSYVQFEIPDDWVCLQEGVAWTCSPQNAVKAKEAVIVLASKVAGPEDNMGTFLNYLKQPKKITTKVGTPMPSQVMYAQQRSLAGNNWVQAQHLGSEIQEYYTLYLATVKEQLAILVSFSAERNHYKDYNPIFDRAIKTLQITATKELLFYKRNTPGANDPIGIQGGPASTINPADIMPPPSAKPGGPAIWMWLAFIAVVLAGAYVISGRKGSSKKRPPRSK